MYKQSGSVYSGFVPKTMAEFLTESFLRWQQEIKERKFVSDFARYLDVNRDLLNQWMNGKRSPGEEYVVQLSARLGPGIYDVEGYEHLHPDIQEITKGWGDLTEDQQQALLKQLEKYRKDNRRGNPGAAAADAA